VSLISVLLPVYNSESFVGDAIDSILNQSFVDFELVIVNDGSTDGSEQIIQSFSDPRIVYLENHQNCGLVATLNTGLARASGVYIARMDADDISCKNRFEKQFAFLGEHPEIGIVGGAIQEITSSGRNTSIHSFPLSHDLIAWSLCFRNPIAHPTVMIRKEILNSVGGYPKEYIIPEDYHLWSNLISTTRFANLPDTVLNYRQHKDSVSSRLKKQNQENRIAISQKVISNYLGTETPLNIVRLLWRKECESEDELTWAIDLILSILRQGEENPSITEAERLYMRQYAARKILSYITDCPNRTRLNVVRTAIKLDPSVIIRTAFEKLTHILN